MESDSQPSSILLAMGATGVSHMFPGMEVEKNIVPIPSDEGVIPVHMVEPCHDQLSIALKTVEPVAAGAQRGESNSTLPYLLLQHRTYKC